MSQSLLIISDIVAVSVLAFALYFPRYGRRDMIVAILGLNVGVLVVSSTLSTAEVGAGLGLGLFGVLSIIRLRSSELEQEEIAYYFTALALGLLGGISADPFWLSPALMVVLLAVLFIGDHPKLFAQSRSQIVTLDSAFTDEQAIVNRIEQLFGVEVRRLRVQKVDLVNDSTVVDVRFKLLDGATQTELHTELFSDQLVGGRR